MAFRRLLATALRKGQGRLVHALATACVPLWAAYPHIASLYVSEIAELCLLTEPTSPANKNIGSMNAGEWERVRVCVSVCER